MLKEGKDQGQAGEGSGAGGFTMLLGLGRGGGEEGYIFLLPSKCIGAHFSLMAATSFFPNAFYKNAPVTVFHVVSDV